MRTSKNIHIFVGVALLSLLAGCQQEEIPTPQPAGDGTVITFNSPYTMDTRSAAMRYGSFKKDDKVGVLGFCKDQVQGNSDAAWDVKKQFCTPDVFYNQELTYDGAGAWNYEWSGTFDSQGPVGTLHPWSLNEDDTFSFFAYYPYADVDGNGVGTITIDGQEGDEDYGLGTIKLSGKDHRGDPEITYTMPFPVGGTNTSDREWWYVPDFMLAYKVDHLKTDGSVQLNFRHLLCAFEFEVNNYNDEDVIIKDFYFGGGETHKENNENVIDAGFYRSFTVTGQQSGYDVKSTDMYVGRFQLIGRDPDNVTEDSHILTDFTCPAQKEGTSIDYKGSPISILLIPDADGALTTDKNKSVYIKITASIGGETVDYEVNNSMMNLVDLTFEPGVRNIFTINIIGNDFYVQMRSDGRWEDDGDSEIVFE